MLLTAMYSEDEADVTAVQILESAFPFRRENPGEETVPRKKRSDNVLTHENQEQRCSRATLSQKCNSSTSNNQSQQSFSTLIFEALKRKMRWTSQNSTQDPQNSSFGGTTSQHSQLTREEPSLL